MQSGLSSHGCRRIRAERLRAGFALVEVLIALFVVALGIAGAAGLQTLAVRAGRDAMRLSDATRLARSLAERMRANPRALALPDAANPYLLLDYDAGSGPPTAPPLCYADADCDADALARFDLFEVSGALASGFPGGRIRVCRDVPNGAKLRVSASSNGGPSTRAAALRTSLQGEPSSSSRDAPPAPLMTADAPSSV